MILPNLFILGFPKCGTTSLHEYLLKHPMIGGDKVLKEPYTLDSDFNIPHRLSKSEYNRINEKYSNLKYQLDGSVLYIYSDSALRTISRQRDYKVIILVRDPLKMINSYFNALKYVLQEEAELDILSAWNMSGKYRENVPKHCYDSFILNYKEITNYKKYVENALDILGKKNVLLLDLNKLIEAPEHLNSVWDFLDLDPVNLDEFKSVNSSKTYKNQYFQNWLNNSESKLKKSWNIIKNIFMINHSGFGSYLYKINSLPRANKPLSEDEVKTLKVELRDQIEWYQKI